MNKKINHIYSDIMTLFFKPEILTTSLSYNKVIRTSEYAIVLVNYRNYIEEIFST